MRVKKFLLGFLTFNLFFLNPLHPLSLAQTLAQGSPKSFKINLTFDKPSYTSQETSEITLVFSNNSPASLKGAKVNLKILKIPPARGRILFNRRWSKTLPRGSSSFKFSKEISRITSREGVYPVKVKVISRGEALTETESSLVVVNPIPHPPLNLALVWNIETEAHFNPGGEFIDEKIQKDLRDDPQNLGLYFEHLNSLNKHPSLKVNYNFTPLNLEQIFKISKGYYFLRKGKVKKIDAESKESTSARKLLQEWENLIKNGQIEPLLSPYARPSLTTLSELDWEEDIIFQIEEGRNLSQKIFKLSDKRGFYPPYFELDANSLELIFRKTNAPYTILKRSLFYIPKEKNPYHPYKIKGPTYAPSSVRPGGLRTPSAKAFGVGSRTGKASASAFRATADRSAGKQKGKEFTLFFREELPLNFSQEKEAETLAQNLIGHLASIYLNRAQEPKVVVLAPEENLSFSFLDSFYTKVEKISWLKTVSLKEAKEAVPPLEVSLKFKKRKEKEGYQERYFKNLAKARADFYLYLAVAEEPLILRKRLLKDLLIAEGSTSQRFTPPAVGLNFVRDLQRKVNKEKAKIKFSQEKKITFASREGKIPIAIQNQASYKWRAFLSLKGEGFSFPQGNSKKVILKPKDNLFTFPVSVREGTFPLEVRLESGGQVIKKVTFQVTRASSFSRQLLFFLSLFLGFLFFLLLLLSRRRLIFKRIKK